MALASALRSESSPLKRVLGAATAWCVGMGVAIGSGIFRTPGEVAEHLPSGGMMLLAWLAGGAIVLMQGMVTAEVATRFPQAGGEYVFLREAYGRFFAFFFGWAYTVFVIGAGSAVIAIALGDFACELLCCPKVYGTPIAAVSVAAVIGVNLLGLRAGAGTQNVLTGLKIASLLVLIALALMLRSGSPVEGDAMAMADATPQTFAASTGWIAFLPALLHVLWSYDGTNDSVKLAEEIKDVRRAMPRALIGATASLTLLYAGVNLALLHVIPAAEMAGAPSAPSMAMERLLGPFGRVAVLIVAILVCLGSLSSTVPATVRVTFALARDGLTFRRLAYMSGKQAPTFALLAVGALIILFTLWRNFTAVLGIYFLAATVLYGLSYASLIVFRRREAEFPPHVFRCPFGYAMAVAVILIQTAVAVHIAVSEPRNALYTLGLLVLLGLLYLVWPKPNGALATDKPFRTLISVSKTDQVSVTFYARAGKRVLDAIAAALLILLLSPLLLVISLLIKLTSRGPVFFTQDRGGWRGAPFRLIKFRTMRGGRKPDPKEIVPLDHPEITPVGRILRRFKLDELPQLFNVLRGDMSLIGPRPTLLDQVAAYDEFRRQRLLARPGITGLAQVYGNSLVSWDERILYDIAYVRRCSLLLDLQILARTPLVVLLGEHATTRAFEQSPFRPHVEIPADWRS